MSADAFPVGAVYINVTGVNPATELGYGTWSRIAQGQMLVGQKDGDADFGTVEGVGGDKTHTHDDHPALDHAGAAVANHAAQSHAGAAVANHAALAAHQHELPIQFPTATVMRKIAAGTFGQGSSRAATCTATLSASTLESEVELSEDVSGGTPDAHVVTQPNDHGALSHVVTQPDSHATQSHSSPSHLNPFFVIYAWKRTL